MYKVFLHLCRFLKIFLKSFFLLSAGFLVPTTFAKLYFHFHLFSILDLLVFLAICCWFLIPFHCVREHTLYNLNFKNFVKMYFMAQNLFHLGESYMWVWEECVCLLWLDEVLYKWCCSVQLCPYWIFCQLDLLIPDRGVWKSLATIINSSSSLYDSISFCLIYFDALLLGSYEVGNVMSS